MRRRRGHTFRNLGLLFALAVDAGGCGNGVGPNGNAVGATCTSSSQCTRECITGDQHYPGGICTIPCASDAECPGGTVCIDDHGGMCAVSCGSNADCTQFGRGFVCDARDRRGTPGGTLVCRVP